MENSLGLSPSFRFNPVISLGELTAQLCLLWLVRWRQADTVLGVQVPQDQLSERGLGVCYCATRIASQRRVWVSWPGLLGGIWAKSLGDGDSMAHWEVRGLKKWLLGRENEPTLSQTHAGLASWWWKTQGLDLSSCLSQWHRVKRTEYIVRWWESIITFSGRMLKRCWCFKGLMTRKFEK